MDIQQNHLDYITNILEIQNSKMLLIDSDTSMIIKANKLAIDFYGYSESFLYSSSIFNLAASNKNFINSDLKNASICDQSTFVIQQKLGKGSTFYFSLN